jgi:hypothetical protein
MKQRNKSHSDWVRERFAEQRDLLRTSVVEPRVTAGELDVSSAYEISGQHLGNYVSLDFYHWLALRRVYASISNYARDATRLRPLNILMHAEPGSGKSFLVKALANSIRTVSVSAVDFNMSTLQGVEDFVQPLDAVRNLKVQDTLPILFLDEFDSDKSRVPLLLPLLWDGELSVAHRNLKVGKVVIILAGSGRFIGSEIAQARSMHARESTADGKMVDLLSRINGGEIEIPPLDLVSEDRDRRVDKICLAISLIEARFGRTELIPWSLLHFVANTKFRYGVRSIAHLVDTISAPANKGNRTHVEKAQLPEQLNSVQLLKESSLAYHIYADDGPASVIELWHKACSCEDPVRVRPPLADEQEDSEL